MSRILLLIGLCVVGVFSQGEFRCNKPPPDKAALPADLIKEAYSLTGEGSSPDDPEKFIEFSESGAKDRNAILRNKVGEKSKQWIFALENHPTVEMLIDDGKTCTPTSKTTADPYMLPAQLKTDFTINDRWTSIKDILKTAGALKDGYIDTNETHAHGLPVKSWFGCKTTGTKVLEMSVCYTDGDFKPIDEPAGTTIPVRIDIKIYDVGGTKMEYSYVYEISNVKGHLPVPKQQEADIMLPPEGVFCENLQIVESKDIPELPQRFSVSVEYIDMKEKRIDWGKVIYDNVSHIAAFEFSKEEKDWLGGKLGLTTTGHTLVVHDFDYGLQYVIKPNTKQCIENVKPIPNGAFDVIPYHDNKTHAMGLMGAAEMLTNAFELTYRTVGVRYTADNIPASVHIARNEPDKRTQENWFSTTEWQVDDIPKTKKTQTLFQVKMYHDDESVTSQKYHSFIDYTEGPFNWRPISIRPCLKFSDSGNMFGILTGIKTVSEMDKTYGVGKVMDAMRETIANLAGVSPLRVDNFYFMESKKKDSVKVFFAISDPSGIAGAPTAYKMNETKAADALTKLNITFNKQDTPLESIPKLKIQKESVIQIPRTFFPGSPGHSGGSSGSTGASGGAMFALALCMMLVGGAIGMGVAWWLWKRNRGIAYQVYE